MPSIVADTTPLNYLVLVEAVRILPELFAKVMIPPAVKAELAHRDAPSDVAAWIATPPSWLEVVSPRWPVDSSLAHLDPGEREAISLATELQTVALLMDERDGVSAARERGLKVIGTLGVLDLAAQRALVDLPSVFEKLSKTSFRTPQRLMTMMLEQDAERKRNPQS
jgi:predicted nucleic acid-binding protein